MLPTVLFDILKLNAPWTKYLVSTTVVIVCGTMYTVVSYHPIIMLVFPLVCASLYSERKALLKQYHDSDKPDHIDYLLPERP